jgi:hypothetical protein
MEALDRPAPEGEITLSDGTRKPLKALWQAQPLVLVFLRHFG